MDNTTLIVLGVLVVGGIVVFIATRPRAPVGPQLQQQPDDTAAIAGAVVAGENLVSHIADLYAQHSGTTTQQTPAGH